MLPMYISDKGLIFKIYWKHKQVSANKRSDFNTVKGTEWMFFSSNRYIKMFKITDVYRNANQKYNEMSANTC